MLATEALAADKQSRTVEEMSDLLAKIECRSSIISGSTDCSTAGMYESLADCFRCGKKGSPTRPGGKQFQECNFWGGSTNFSQISILMTVLK